MASPFERNQQYVRKGEHEYNTPLSRADEKRFLEWVQKNDVQFRPMERTSDYDMRGFWQALTDPKHPDHAKAQTAINPNDKQIHYPDYWKTPYHQSFSRDSQWATKDAPRWNRQDQLVDRSGKVVFDERRQSRAPIEGTDMARRSSRPQEKTGIDKAFDRFLRFGNDQIPGAKPQRNVVEELLGNLGRGRAGIREGLVPPDTRFRSEPQQRGATLREGMSGPQVKALQDDLVRAGLLDRKAADGKFAGATAAAVRQLEQMHGLNRDAGVAGRQVLGQLRGNAMPPPVPTQKTAPAAPPARTEPVPTRLSGPVTQQNLPPPVTAAPPPIPPPSPTPSPTPQVTAPTAQPNPLQTAIDAAAKAAADRAAADAQRAAPSPQTAAPPAPPVSPEWQAYIDSQKDAKLRAGEDRGMEGWPPQASPVSPPMGGPGAGTRTSSILGPMGEFNPAAYGDPRLMAAPPPGPPADMALRRAEDQFGGSRFTAPPASGASLEDRRAAAQVAADKALRDAQTAPQVAPPPSAALPGLGNPLAGASSIGQALGGMGGLGPAFQQLAGQATPATAPPAGQTPIVDRSVFGPGYNADPLGGKEQGRLGSSYGPRGGPLSSAELPPGYVPPLPPRADIAFNAPSLSPAAPKTDRGGFPADMALRLGEDRGMPLAGMQLPSIQPIAAQAAPIPQIQAPPAPQQQQTTRGISGAGREPPPEQLKAELQAALMNRIDDMKAGLATGFANPPLPADMALRAGEDTGMRPGMPAMGSGLGQSTIGTANNPFPNFPTPGLAPVGDRANEPRPSQYEAPTGAFLGDIPTVAPPPMESIVQPQIDQGGQGLLGGQGLGDQTQVEGPAAGRSDAQGVLDAISQADFTGVNQQDQQPGGDQGTTASAASGDNPFTAAQTAEQQGILAMLEEMFGEGSPR